MKPIELAIVLLLVAVSLHAQVSGLTLTAEGANPLGFRDLESFSEILDVDGDGDRDVLTTSCLYLSDGQGRFVRRPLPTDLALVNHAVGDLDGDGDPDLYTQGGVHLNDGLGGFIKLAGALPVIPAPACSAPRIFDGVAMADFDGDGDLDVFIAEPGLCAGGGVGHVLLNDGTGRFTLSPGAALGTGYEGGHYLAVDSDVDGDIDLFGVLATSTTVFLNDGTGRFMSSGPFGWGTGGELLASGDVDGDGRLDTVVHRPGNFEVFLGTASGLVPSPLSFTSERPQAMELIDLDGDGADELCWLGAGGFAVAPVTSTGAVAAVSSRRFFRSDVATSPTLVAGDLDRDGDDDVAMSVEGRSLTFINDGLGGFEELARHDLAAINPVDGAVGDFDLDGELDLLVQELVPGGVRVGSCLNDGRGRFDVDPSSWSTINGPVGELAHVFDANGDGTPDVYISSQGVAGASDIMLLNLGGAWTVAWTSLIGDVSAIVSGDVDGDGFIDVVLGRGGASAQDVVILAGNGLGGFAAQRLLDATSATNFVTDVEIGDIDLDGDLDVVLARSLGDSRAYVNDGSGNFTISFSFPGGPHLGSTLADFDGDGWPDLALGSFVRGNTGAGTFGGGAALPAAPAGRMTSADLDGDGDLDILSADGDVFYRSASLQFIHQPPLPHGGIGLRPSEPFVSDVDADGDLDVIAHGHVLWNEARQLTSRGDRRLGGVMDIDLRTRGALAGAWWLLASLNTVDIAVPPFGRLLVDPASSVLFASGLSPAAGTATAVVPIPNNGAIAGVDIHWQVLSVMGPEVRFSNSHTTTLRP